MTESDLGPYSVEECVVNASGYTVLLSEIILRILFLSDMRFLFLQCRSER